MFAKWLQDGVKFHMFYLHAVFVHTILQNLEKTMKTAVVDKNV